MLQNSFPKQQSLYFYAFDLLAYRGKDLRKLPLVERRVLLEKYALDGLQERLSATFSAKPKQLIAAARKSGLEGVVAKRAKSHYEAGERTGAWVKYKTNKGQELVIGGFKPGTIAFE
ncbi:MAG: bifunctional non-ous end joining protein LigD [Blastocatellia bacterium]|jgi:bifunctional non-homologous end joining protein LigD|nr:bifunctional non-ous end joining protein LigD [Blastocatellia bacterium]